MHRQGMVLKHRIENTAAESATRLQASRYLRIIKEAWTGIQVKGLSN